jgi:integrase/recombinase XerC
VKSLTIAESVQLFFASLQISRSESTRDTYGFAVRAFTALLAEKSIDPETAPVSALEEDAVIWFSTALKELSPATEELYLQAVARYYEFLYAEQLHSPNLSRIRLLIRNRGRNPGQKFPQFPREDINKVLDFVQTLPATSGKNENEKLRNLRDCAFVLTLADTGLRVHEACKLRRGDIDWNEGRAVIIGKGDKQAIIRFSSRSMNAMKIYLSARSSLDGASGKPLTSLPLFSRHDKGAGKKVKPITTATGRNIVDERVRQALGDSAEGKITPHSFRHYFVTTVLRATGNLKLAQELA